MKITDKIGDKELKIKSSMHDLYINPKSPMMCDKCNKHLGLLRMLCGASGKKKGVKYLVVCKRCNHINERIKGEMANYINNRWDQEAD